MAGKHRIGVLALQGGFAKHIQMLEGLGIPSLQVRYPHDLDLCDGLILPGGESTAMTQHIVTMGLLTPLKNFASRSPLFGTCAGMILMARTGILDLLDITVERNSYGRQYSSFATTLSFCSTPLQALFIRAPRIITIDSSDVQVLATHDGEAVCIQQGLHMASSFHPELTNDPTMHLYFSQHL